MPRLDLDWRRARVVPTLALAAVLAAAPVAASPPGPRPGGTASVARGAPSAALADTGRVRRWQEDLRFVVGRITSLHPRPFAFAPRAAFDSAAAAIEARIARADDATLAVELMRLTALLSDGHTMTIGTLPPLGFTSVLPLSLRPFEDGLHVAAAGPGLAGAVGARVLRIGALPAERALERVLGMTSGDNRYSRLERAPLFLMIPAALRALGVSADPRSITLEIERPGGRSETITVAGGPPPAGFPEAFLETEPRLPADWTSARQVAGADLPRCDRLPDEAWWFEFLAPSRVLYLRMRRVDPVSGPRVYTEFYREVFAAIDSLRPAALVVDLRHNHGGNNTILDPLVRGIVQRPWLDRDGGLFALVDRGTFSAAMNAAVFLEDRTLVRFAGEPTGGRVNHYGDAPETRTPHLGMMVQVSTLPWMSRNPSDDRPWIAPHLAVPTTFATWREGGDPALDAVLEVVARGTLQQRALSAARRGGAEAVRAACEEWTERFPNPWRDTRDEELAALVERLLYEGATSDAVRVGEAWTGMSPESARAWRWLGGAHMQGGERAKAVAALRRVLELEPRARIARVLLRRLGEEP